jgi:hypothetical protein
MNVQNIDENAKRTLTGKRVEILFVDVISGLKYYTLAAKISFIEHFSNG